MYIKAMANEDYMSNELAELEAMTEDEARKYIIDYWMCIA